MAKHLTNRMWFSVVYSLIDNDTRHHSGQNVVPQKKHISICFLPHNINVKENVFSERELKKALRDTLTRAAW